MIRQLLCGYDGLEPVSEARTGREASAVMASTMPEILFVDAELPDTDCFELVHRARGNPTPAVVVVASSDSFAVRAFEEQALDYLVRPVRERRLARDLSVAPQLEQPRSIARD